MAVVNPRRIDQDELDRVVQDFSSRYPSIEVTCNLDGSATLRGREGNRVLRARVNADGIVTHQQHDIVED